MTEKLTLSDIQASIAVLNLSAREAWQIKKGKLHKTFIFADFISAFAFMTSVALSAEKMNHHPEWFNSYKRVEIDLFTHEVDGISEQDFSLAATIEKIYQPNLS